MSVLRKPRKLNHLALAKAEEDALRECAHFICRFANGNCSCMLRRNVYCETALGVAQRAFEIARSVGGGRT